ncbi:MAG: acyl-CoA dehydrogenase [Archangiaceae bacterium]|nr:acyl-CoA dehydrogenase [Archangiaceae bacterium]
MSASANHYKPNLRDTLFNLFEFLEIGKTSLGKKPFGDLDEETARQTLESYKQICVDQLATSFSAGDHQAPVLDTKTGNVTLPESLKKSFHAYFDNGLNQLEIPTHLGGVGAPPSLSWGAFEMVLGANAPLAFYFLGNLLPRVIDRTATESQKALFGKLMIDKRWGGTMVLTEPDAGSDVGNARAKAKHIKDDVWEIEGVKRFITNGDFDAVENIVHLVLARPEGAGGGTKGLSMFIVPKFWVNPDGSLGERNGVFCTNLEKKMGLKSSTTCEMTFGDGKPARGLLVGNVHEGIKQMFHVIEHARMAVGLKSAATLSTAYLNALSYAKDRIQGPDLMNARDKNAKKVAIIRHADVRRMLMLQKSHAEGMRAMILFAASLQDEVEILGGHHDERAAASDALNDLMLPLIKGYCSEKAYELLAVSLQTLGGSGYLQDYPMEQYVRDQKIDSLYEGTTHIQALDLILRKLAKDGGATLQGLLGRIRTTLETNEGGDALAKEREALNEALTNVEMAFGHLLEKLGESLYHAGLQGNRLLFGLAELVIGWLLIRHAAVALKKRATATGEDAAFYDGKVASARFFASEVLPNLVMLPKHVSGSTLKLMELADEAF